MLNQIKIPKKLKFVFICFFLIISVLLVSCAEQNASTYISNTPSIITTPEPILTESSTPEINNKLTAEFQSPKIIGSSRVIACGKIISDDVFDDVGFILENLDDEKMFELSGILFEENYYIQLDNLSDGAEYLLKMYYVTDGKKEYSENHLSFETPKKIYTDEQVDEMLNKAIKGDSSAYKPEKLLVASTQRALSLIDILCGDLGIKSYFLQVNQIKLEYSYNSYERYVNWDAVDGECDQDTVNILKDIISVNEVLEYDDIFFPFVPTPHALSDYNKYDEDGGQFDAEQYLYDNLKNDDTAYASYLEYPFIYESVEFQEKYSKLIEENESQEELSVDINHAIAENKFLFSYYNRAYMDKYAIPQDRTIELYFAGGLTIQTAVAFCYLVTEIPKGYDKLYISTSLRDYSTQAHFYTKGAGMEKALSYGDYWHLFRQNNSYVPGFSNHQYGIAIDFNDIQTFKSNRLYEYLKENAQKYGFYNYYREAWHWVYLGE